ncbi:hypothetical protein RFI_19155, partial [Reticulomyxa filosa]
IYVYIFTRLIFSFLAKAYAAECCIHLNRIREARAVLDPHTEQTTTTEATPRTSKDHHHFLNSDQEKEKEKDKEKEKEKEKDKEREKDKQKTLSHFDDASQNHKTTKQILNG